MAACRSGDPRSVVQELRARGTPTMEEIFLLPGIQGRAPSAEQFSADGRWVFFRYNPLETGPDGTRKISDAHALRVQSTLAPEATTFVGQRIDDLLPTPEAPAAGPDNSRSNGASISLSHHGARVLAQRDQEVFLLDAPESAAGTWTARKLLRADPDGPLKKLEFARFSEADDAVLVDVVESPAREGSETVRDLWSFPLRAQTPTPWPLSANDGVNLTAAIEVDSRKLVFSRDLRAVFVPESRRAAGDAPADPIWKIVWLDSGKTVELDGGGELKSFDLQLSPDGRFLFGSVVYKSEKLHPTL
ncbi:MAG TPA: hypothetical protein VM509_00170, partial [Planctomycetota bacterium]|nr:hypothetical protein [Planctomycetota bacterium]